MNKVLFTIILFVLNAGCTFAEVYKVYVKRVEQNLYKDMNSGVYIVTKWCYEYTYGEDAVLKYEQYSYSNKLIFDSGTSCDVDKLLK